MDTIKTAQYFPVLTNNYNSTLSLDIRMTYGWSGYGIYFAMLQKLASVPTRRLPLNQLKAIAFDLHCTPAELQPIIENYFTTEDIEFYSEELNASLGWYDEKYNKSSEGGKKAAAKLTSEQLSDRAKKAADKRWNETKNEVKPETEVKVVNDGKNDDNANPLASDAKPLAFPVNTPSIPLASYANNKIKENEIEEKEKEQKIKEENKKEDKEIGLNKNTASLPSVSSSSVSSETSNIPKPLFNSYEIEEEIRTFIPNYISDSNFSSLEQLYIQFRMTYPHSNLRLDTFEKIYFYYIANKSTNQSSNKEINTWLYETNPIIDLKTILLVLGIIKKDDKIQTNYKYVISNYKLDSILQIEKSYQ